MENYIKLQQYPMPHVFHNEFTRQIEKIKHPLYKLSHLKASFILPVSGIKDKVYS